MTILSKNVREFDFFCASTVNSKPAVAISACLNGHAVRYDAKNKSLSTRIVLSQHLHLVEQCPEVSAGLSVPRPAVQLVQIDNNTRAIGRDDTTLDVTDALLLQREKSMTELKFHRVCGYIAKSKSPSCGVGSTPIFDQQDNVLSISNGLHADYVLKNLPWIVIIDENRLQTCAQCEHFIFLCLLIHDLQLAIEKEMLKKFDTHYQQVFEHIDKKPHQSILSITKNNDVVQYQTMFRKKVELFLHNSNV